MIDYKVILTRRANRDEAAIYKYISRKFGESYADKFRENLLKLLHLLSQQPFIGRIAKSNATLRVYIFSKQNKIVYKRTENSLVIIRILNTKTNLSEKF